MNFKVFALGAVLGLAVAVAPSCGAATKCSVSNCKGCCSSDGKCVADPNNANNTSCGTQGNACVDCTKTNQVCNKSSFQCGVTGTGGGDGSDSGVSTCGGCTTSSGLCLENVSFTNCGANGSACVSCQMGQYCSNGACQTPDAGTSTTGLGAACTQSSECTGVKLDTGFSAICKTSTSPGNNEYKAGYCTRRCTSNAQCDTGNICLTGAGVRGELENICVKGCSGAAGSCREGYACYNFGNNQGGCWVVQSDGGIPDRYDAGNPNPTAAGAACTTDQECGGGPGQPALGCNKELLPDGGPSGYWGGQCAGNCSLAGESSFCGDGGVCQGYIFNVGAPGPLVMYVCEASCVPGMAGTCRTDYVCDPTPNSNPARGSCIPDCRKNPALICNTAADCNAGTGLCN